MGPGPFNVWRHVRIMQKELVLLNLCMPHVDWSEVDLYMRWKWRCDSLKLKSAAGALFVVFAGLLEDQLSISWERNS